MSKKFTVKLQYTRHLQFEVEAESASQAYTDVRDGFEQGDCRPDDDWADDLELEAMQLGDREVEFQFDYDWKAPKDERGLAPLKAIASDAKDFRRIDSDLDTGALLDRLFPMRAEQEGAA